MSDIDEFEAGLQDRQARVVIAASNCVRHLRREMTGTMGKVDKDKLLTGMSQTRFNPVYQRELIEAIWDFHDFETGSGKYRMSDAERLVRLKANIAEGNAAPWMLKEVERLSHQ